MTSNQGPDTRFSRPHTTPANARSESAPVTSSTDAPASRATADMPATSVAASTADTHHTRQPDACASRAAASATVVFPRPPMPTRIRTCGG